jgi:hypothetical protein
VATAGTASPPPGVIIGESWGDDGAFRSTADDAAWSRVGEDSRETAGEVAVRSTADDTDAALSRVGEDLRETAGEDLRETAGEEADDPHSRLSDDRLLGDDLRELRLMDGDALGNAATATADLRSVDGVAVDLRPNKGVAAPEDGPTAAAADPTPSNRCVDLREAKGVVVDDSSPICDVLRLNDGELRDSCTTVSNFFALSTSWINRAKGVIAHDSSPIRDVLRLNDGELRDSCTTVSNFFASSTSWLNRASDTFCKGTADHLVWAAKPIKAIKTNLAGEQMEAHTSLERGQNQESMCDIPRVLLRL